MTKLETVKSWLNRTHKERYEKCKNYRIIDVAKNILLSETCSYYTSSWFYDDVMKRYVSEVEETNKEFIVTARRKE